MRVLAIVALLAGTAAALWRLIEAKGTASYRYKLTLAVNTPDGIKRASSVAEVKYRKVSVPARRTVHSVFAGAQP